MCLAAVRTFVDYFSAVQQALGLNIFPPKISGVKGLCDAGLAGSEHVGAKVNRCALTPLHRIAPKPVWQCTILKVKGERVVTSYDQTCIALNRLCGNRV